LSHIGGKALAMVERLLSSIAFLKNTVFDNMVGAVEVNIFSMCLPF